MGSKRARGQRDSKAKALVAWLKDTSKPGGKWSKERVIIFTEYRATQNWLQERLCRRRVHGWRPPPDDVRWHGTRSDREAVKAAFQTSPDISPVRILLATDAASEGIRPPELLLAPHPLRNPVEPQPHGAAEWACGSPRAKGSTRFSSTTSSAKGTRIASDAGLSGTSSDI